MPRSAPESQNPGEALRRPVNCGRSITALFPLSTCFSLASIMILRSSSTLCRITYSHSWVAKSFRRHIIPLRPRAFSATAMAALQHSPFFEAIEKHDPTSTAVVHSLSGRSFSYGSLLRDVSLAKSRLLRDTQKDENNIAGERVAFMVENSYDYVGAQSIQSQLPTSSNKLSSNLSHSPRRPCIQCRSRPISTVFPSERAPVHH